jgi:hypothetical protein
MDHGAPWELRRPNGPLLRAQADRPVFRHAPRSAVDTVPRMACIRASWSTLRVRRLLADTASRSLVPFIDRARAEPACPFAPPLAIAAAATTSLPPLVHVAFFSSCSASWCSSKQCRRRYPGLARAPQRRQVATADRQSILRRGSPAPPPVRPTVETEF